jgi:hypothetical protein
MRKFARRAICVALCCLPAGEAMALDAQSFIDRFEAALELNFGVDFVFGPAKMKGDAIVVSGMSVGDFCPYQGAEPLRIAGELRLIGVSEGADGAYSARAATLPAFEAMFDGADNIALSLAGIEAYGIYLAPGEMSVTDAAAMAGRVRITGIEAGFEGYPLLSAQALEFNSSHMPEPGDGELTRISDTLTIAGITLDLATLLEQFWMPPDFVAAVEDNGLGTINANFALSQDWALTEGEASTGTLTLGIEDGGRLTLDLGWLGYTAEVWQESSQHLNELYSTTDCANSAILLAAEEQSWQMLRNAIELTHASVRYRDNSLASKLVTLAAEAQGVDTATVTRALGKTLTHELAAFGLGDHGDAITAFLSDPQGFLLSANLAAPMRFSQISDAFNAGVPIDTLLGLTARANPPD